MNKKLKTVQIVVIILAIVFGTLLHFTYEWSGENRIVGLFSATNESVWEHLKLVFYPMLILAIVEYFVVKKEANNYIEAKSLGIFLAIAFIIVFYYTYTGIIGKNFFIIDILTFIISIILGEWVSYKLMIRKSESTTLSKILSSAIIFYFLISFILFTYNPPNINLFKDPTQIMNRLYM
ncbi:MAG TPA: DUF6512 family protein [Clostridiaceae bacterium]|nr:DUF6512 family protein [Clostridiaceae bacterium]